MVRITLIALFFCCSCCLAAQQRFVAVCVPDLHSASLCTEVEAALRLLPNVESVRAEPTTGNVLLFFLNANGISEDDLNAQLQSFQLSIGCYRTGILGQNQIKRLVYPACKNTEGERKE